MTKPLFTPRARGELKEAVAWIAADNPAAATRLVQTALEAARRVTAKPMLPRIRPELAPDRFRFWSLSGFPYLLVVDTMHAPPVIARVVHQARDLPTALRDLSG